MLIQDELVIAALARWSVPVIPALLTVDLGAGLDQRFSMDIRVLDRTFGINGETTSADISDQNGGPRTLMPISAQVSLDVAMTTLLLEARYNVELASGVIETGPQYRQWKEGGRTTESHTGDDGENDELWLLRFNLLRRVDILSRSYLCQTPKNSVIFMTLTSMGQGLSNS